MKKIICLFTVMCIFSLMVPQTLAENDITNNMENQFVESEETKILKAIGIYEENLETNKPVTRAEVLKPVLKIYGYDCIGSAETDPFIDVSKDSEYSDYILCAKTLGLISGDGNGNYYPDETIEFNSIVKIIVCLLGYGVISENEGGYPFGYIKEAYSLKIINSLSEEEKNNVTYDVLAKLIVPALEVEIADNPIIKNDKLYFEFNDKCLLDLLNLCKVEGVVTENSVTTLKAGKNKDSYSAIGNIRFNTNGIDVDSLIGYNAVAYLSYDKTYEDSNLLYINPINNHVLTIDSKDIIDIRLDTMKVQYSDGKKVKSVNLCETFNFIYNGLACGEYSQQLLNPDYGEIILINNDRDNVYDVLLTERWYDIVVNEINKEDKLIDNKLGGYLELDSDDIAYTIHKNGESIELENLVEWDSLLVTDSNFGLTAENQNTRIINIEATDNRVMGSISGEMTEDEINKYKIEENWFCASPYLLNSKKSDISKPTLGLNGTYLLNDKEYIVGYVISSLDLAKKQYSYIIKIINDTSEEEIIIKAYTEDREFVTYAIKDKVVIDGRRVDKEAVMDKLSVNQVVIFTLNSENNISAIDTADVGSNESMYSLHAGYVDPEGKMLRYKTGTKAFDDKIIIDTETVIFVVPKDAEDKKIYDVANSSIFENDHMYNVSSYIAKEGDFVSAALVYQVDSAVSTLDISHIMVIESCTTKLSEDGEVVEAIKGWSGSKGELELISDDNMISKNNLDTGDVILYAANNKNMLKEVELVYDYSEDDFKKAQGVFGDNPRYIKGYIHRKRGNYFNIITGNLENVNDESSLEVKQLNYYVNACIYNHSEKKIYPATTSDLRDYIGFGQGCTRFIITEAYGDPGSIILYK